MSRLTDARIRRLQPKEKAYKIAGEDVRGRGRVLLIVKPSGVKDFYFRYRAGGADRMIKLGRYGAEGSDGYLTLAQANARARQLGDRLQVTPDLKEAIELEQRQEMAARRAALDAERGRQTKTLAALMRAYVRYLERRGKAAARDVEGLFRRHVTEAFPALAAAPASQVERRDVTALMRRLFDAGKTRTAGKLRSYLGAAYELALNAEGDAQAPEEALGFNLASNPASATRANTGVVARTRVLNDSELRHFMLQLEGLPAMQRDVLQLLIFLGGQRPAQLLRCRVTDLDVEKGRLALLDGKGLRAQPRQHVVPVSEKTLVILEHRRTVAEALGSSWLFTTLGSAPVRLETISTAVKELSDKMLQDKISREPFQLRDIRRTVETQLAALGITRDVRAQLLSHGLSGVQALHYDRHDYMREKLDALLKWEARLDEIRDGRVQASNVIALRVRGAR